MSDLREAIGEGSRLSQELSNAWSVYLGQVKTAAEAERDYRKHLSLKFVEARVKDEFKQAADREAWVNAQSADKRMERDIAEGLLEATKEQIRNLRQQLSYVQTVSNLLKSEQESYRAGQDANP